MCNSTGLTPYLNHILEPSKVVKPLQLNRNAITVRSESATKPIVTRLCNNANNSKSNISHPALLETKYRSDTGFLYIHGKPGTGKTALLKEVIRELKPEMKNVAHDIKILTIDCKAIASNTYSKLLHGMGYGCSSDDEDTAIKTLESIVLGNGTKVIYVAILDEVDHLLTKHQGVFDKLAQWSFTQESKLTVIGVTNDVDTSDHLIHKLKAMDCEPKKSKVLSLTA
ncbi:AAA ATPase [Entomortierella beljakovae]|nr:AAA ATPase [Entomortierella beljakovae]